MYYRLFRGLLAPGVNIIIKYNFSIRGRKVLQSCFLAFLSFAFGFYITLNLEKKIRIF